MKYVTLVDHMGDDQRICSAARVSLNAHEEEHSQKRDKRLIRYLMRHKHSSPFEQVEFTFLVIAPLFVARQWMRHRTWSYNEISGRYTTLPKDYYVPTYVNYKSDTIKQGRGEPASPEDMEFFQRKVEEFSKASLALEEELQERGFAREITRLVTTVNRYTVFYAKVDLNNLLKFLSLRLKSNAQLEIRFYAQVILSLIRPIVPLTVEAWEGLNKDALS